MRAGAAAAVLTALVLTSCAGGASGEDLDGILLQEEEVPGGLRLDQEASGPLKDLEDAFIVKGGLDREVREGFVTGAERTYVPVSGTLQAGRVSFVGSLALRFADREDAGEFMTFSRGFQLGRDAPQGEELPADGLGETGYGVHFTPDRRGVESFGYVWRVGDLVLVVAAGAPAGVTDASGVLTLAEKVDDRVAP